MNIFLFKVIVPLDLLQNIKLRVVSDNLQARLLAR